MGFAVAGSAVAMVGGAVMMGFALRAKLDTSFLSPDPTPGWVAPVGGVGILLTFGGLAGMIAGVVIMSRHEQQLRSLKGEPDEEPPQRRGSPGPWDRYH